jgi:hypothetical protein
MNDPRRILNADSIIEADAAALLTLYPGIGNLLAGIAQHREKTHNQVGTKRATPAEIVRNWQQSLSTVLVGYVFYEASGMTQFGRVSVAIDKRSGQLVTQEW